MVLVLLMLIGAVSAAVVPTFAASESALQAQIEKLEKEQKELQNKINSLSKDQKKQKEYQQALNSQIESLEKQIESLNSQITLYNNKITAKEKEISLKSADIDENFELMKERLAAMQLAGDNSLLMVIFYRDDTGGGGAGSKADQPARLRKGGYRGGRKRNQGQQGKGRKQPKDTVRQKEYPRCFLRKE